MTAAMCKEGSGRLGYTRVLVEIDAGKEYTDNVEISYVDKQMNVKRTKWVRVEYPWKPDKCSHCVVFGHSKSQCKICKATNETVNEDNIKKNNEEENKEGFVEVRNRKNRGENKVDGNNQGNRQSNNVGGNYAQGNRQFNKKMTYNARFVYKPKENGVKNTNGGKSDTPSKSVYESPPSLEKVWNVSSENLKELKRSANKYSVLAEEGNQEKEMERNGNIVNDEEDVYVN
ncbi:hypothetical protein CTI12_AA003540 [Artemisia annua]|uniref:ATPase, F1/V1/A1 complex, alpha/beta subunit, Zinc knuckle CX2CX4HX4C n=1 Tax=Artemisia annua TaxID=35608 RepID=A0A2U1QMK5_ARTAN|nr:hypothetical protein CTI12_AA003540 [Artemisia annua]